MNNIQKTIEFVLELYELKNVRQLENLIQEKIKNNADPKDIAFLQTVCALYYVDCA